MTTVDGITVDEAHDIRDTSIKTGYIDEHQHLILVRRDNVTVDAGEVEVDLDDLVTEMDIHNGHLFLTKKGGDVVDVGPVNKKITLTYDYTGSTSVFTKATYPGMTHALFQFWGGGGGGARGNGSSPGGGGGGGGFFEKDLLVAQIPTSLTISPGNPGLGAVGVGGSATSGGSSQATTTTTTTPSWIIGTGGGGHGGTSDSSIGAYVGGIGGTTDMSIGNNGNIGTWPAVGGPANSTTPGQNAGIIDAQLAGGPGARGYYAAVPAAIPRAPSIRSGEGGGSSAALAAGTAGQAGVTPAGGGAGGCKSTDGTGADGGNGGAGRVVISIYFD